MPSESDLRDLLQGPDPEGRSAIDLDAVLTRSRRRRRPKVVAAQTLGSVAVIGALFTAAVVVVQPPQQASLQVAEDTAGGSDADAAPFVDESALKWMPDVCGAPVTDHPAAETLSVEIAIVTTVEPGAKIPVTVTLRNDGTDRLVGTTGSAPFLTFSRDGIVLWHSYAVQNYSVRVVDLAPGESMTYDAVFERTICSSEEDLVMEDPNRPLPLAGPGVYELRAVLVVGIDDGSSIIASAPAMPIEIR